MNAEINRKYHAATQCNEKRNSTRDFSSRTHTKTSNFVCLKTGAWQWSKIFRKKNSSIAVFMRLFSLRNALKLNKKFRENYNNVKAAIKSKLNRVGDSKF